MKRNKTVNVVTKRRKARLGRIWKRLTPSSVFIEPDRVAISEHLKITYAWNGTAIDFFGWQQCLSVLYHFSKMNTYYIFIFVYLFFKMLFKIKASQSKSLLSSSGFTFFTKEEILSRSERWQTIFRLYIINKKIHNLIQKSSSFADI